MSFKPNRTSTSSQVQAKPKHSTNKSDQQKPTTEKENFRTDPREKSTFRRFHNKQDDSDDEEKRTWNGNSTQQM